MSSRELEQMHRKSMSQTGGWYAELEEVWMWYVEERKALVGAYAHNC